MRLLSALLATAFCAVPCALAQDPAAAPAPASEPPQLTTPNPVPGEKLPEGAEWKTTATGLRYAVIVAGDDKVAGPGPADRVTVNYVGYFENGEKFDGSKPKAPAKFGLNQVIKGWTEGLQLMHPGAKYKFHVPWQLGYGEKGRGPIASKTNMIFDIELISITAAPPPPPPAPSFAMPEDKDLTTTASGLKWMQVKAGRADGKQPAASDTVTVWYAGWLTDGTPFDSAYQRGQPASFALNGVIKGWTEGLQLMREGEICKFVIPAGLAYGAAGRPGIPPGATLVFQVELIRVGS